MNSELDPVLLVPGIVGSILDAVNKKDGSSDQVWVQCYLIVTYELQKLTIHSHLDERRILFLITFEKPIM